MSNPEKNCEQLFSLSMILQGYWCSLISVWKQASSKRVDDFNSETARDCFSAGKKRRGFKSSNLNRRASTGASAVWRKLGGGLLGKLSIVSIIGEYLLYSCLVYM